MSPAFRGHLLSSSSAPRRGEHIDAISTLDGVRLEQILSGELDGPIDYLADHDEWVVVLAGSALLEVDGERVELGHGDWLVLPARTPHRLIKTTPGTNWLVVHSTSTKDRCAPRALDLR